VNARELTQVRGIRDIPRLCECDWRPVFEWQSPTGWRLAFAARECRFHGVRPGFRTVATVLRTAA
jgi:hypothetical protein